MNICVCGRDNLPLDKDIIMGIPRFYRWLKGRYPLIRFDLADSGKQRPSFDNLYIDFNALVYQCIRESGCFLKNKVKPLTEEQIIERVIEYLLELVRVANPKKFLYIALDGVAPRAKINQSRDRRFKSGVEDIEFFDELAEKIGITTQEIFQANSISPGTAFLFSLCQRLRGKIMELMGSEWRELIVMYSDCCAPGEGEHKIMDFLRYAKSNQLFNKNTTHCVYSPDADVILLTLAMNLDYICIIKEDTSQLPSMAWTATSTFRKFGPPQFELVMINILREYFEREYVEVLQRVKSCTVQKIINDLVLLMAFVGNDFLPNEFCFVLKDSHLDALFKQYREYLLEHEEYINNEGSIDWSNVSKLLKLARRFEANMISEMKSQRSRNRQSQHNNDGTVFDDKERGDEASEQYDSELQKFEVQDNKIVQGIESYYASRFNIQDRLHSKQFQEIIVKYIEGLEFYCQYYYKGLPSWTWYYPFHYTPLLCDVDDYISRYNVKVQLQRDQPFEPILALMFMFPEQNFGLLPKPIAERLLDPRSILRSPLDYYPRKFELDRFQTLKYNKHALIPFLKEADVRKVYESVPKEAYSKQEIERNTRRESIIFFQNKDSFTGLQVAFNQRFKEELRKIIRPKYDGKQKESNQRRFPTLYIYGENIQINEKGCIVPEYKYKHNGNPTELVFFNNFIGYVDRVQRAPVEVKAEIEDSYVRAGIFGTCENYFVVKRGQFVREVERFHVALTNREVVVPDFALFKAPNYDYIRKTRKFEYKELYKPKERVIVLTQKYFGCIGIVEEVGDKNVKVRLIADPIKTEEKIEEFDEEFYQMQYVQNELEISKDTLLSIISEVILLPRMGKKKDFNERLPSSLNFGLNFIDVNAMKIVPRFVRCNFAHENTKNPQSIFDYLEISHTGLSVLHKYVSEFPWLVEAIEDSRSSKLKKEFKASTIFAKEKDPNIRLYQEFVKLYQLDTKGPFQSIYSRIASHNLPALYTDKKANSSTVTLAYHEIFSRTQAFIAPPAYKAEPEYHDIGSRVILLRTLEVGYVVGIDDNWIHVAIGKEKRRSRVRFTDLYNENWENNLSRQLGKGWNLEVSYYTPTYWKPAIAK